MKKRLIHILLLLSLSLSIFSQIPYAFRYQASVRNAKNMPINEQVVFDIRLFTDQDAINEVYREIHIIQPDTNGIVAFSIGQGASNDDFESIDWAENSHFIQVLLDDQELSYSQLVSVPYAMHAATASSIHNLQEPVLDNDPSTKKYVDASYSYLLDSIAQLNKTINENISLSKAYADSLSLAPKDLEITSAGDTLQIGNQKVVIAGMSSDNLEKYETQQCLGGSYDESISHSLLCEDKGLLILGNSMSGNGNVSDHKGSSDIWVVKTDQNLKLLWEKTLGGSLYDHASFVLQEEDGYLIAGTSESSDFDLDDNAGNFDLFLIKLDLNGNTLWSESYGGSNTEFFNSIVKLENGNYLIGATTFSNDGDVYWNYGNADMWVFEIDDQHAIIKERIIGGTRYDALQAIKVNTDNTITIWGSSASNDGTVNNNNGNLDILSTTLNNNLEIISHTCYGSTDNEQYSNQLELEGNTIIYGQTYASSLSIDNNVRLNNIRLECIGTNNWVKSFGGSFKDEIIEIQEKNDTLLILAQTTSSDGDVSALNGGQDIWLLQLSLDGELIQEKCLGGTYDEGAQVIIPWKEGWLIGGTSESKDQDLENNAGQKDIWLVVLDKQLNILWQNNFGGSYTDLIDNIIPNDDGTVTIIGTTASNDYRITGLHDKVGESNDIWILNTTIE